ncbi:MAG: hypothetical protein ACU843_00990 [Gammaproteobacteria bacterium]
MGKCIDVPKVFVETLVLGIDLVGFEPGNIKEAGRIARNKDARKAIQKAIDKANKELTESFLKGEAITNKVAVQKLKDVGKGVGSALTDHAKHAFTRQLGCAWNGSPLGIWVDENKWILYIVVPLLVGGAAVGAGYLYQARVGDRPVGVLTSLAEPHLKFQPIGSLTLGVTDLEFKPSERKIQSKLFSNIKWQPLEVGFSLTAGAGNGELTKLRLQNTLSYNGGGVNGNLKWSVNTFLQHDAEKGRSFGGGVGGSYQFFSKALDANLRFGAEANIEQRYSRNGSKAVGTVLFSFGKSF